MKLRDIMKENLNTPSFTQVVRDWFKSKGYDLNMSKNLFQVYDKSGEMIFERKTNSFFRSAHLESFANQVAKQEGFRNDLPEYTAKIYKY